MRKIKKIFASLLLVCMLTPCISMAVNAASAELRFTDPSTTVGAEVEVTARLSSASNLLSLETTLTYDTSMLRFISGDSATGGNGTINISGSGSGTKLEFVLKFQALEEGVTKIEISQASGTDASGASLQITEGSSTITIEEGDPSLITDEGDSTASVGDGPQVEVDGVQYVITNNFSDAVIPNGFEKGEMTFEGETCQIVTQAASGESAMYLTPISGGESDFFLYISDTGTFIPFEEVEIATDRYIVLLRDDGSVQLPGQYQETTLTIGDGKEFTAWQDTDNAEYYIIYALNADGQKTLYQYDTVDKTYQRYIEQAVTEDSSEKASPSGLWGKILQFIEDFLDIVVIIGGIILLLLLVVLIVVGIKLRHRNLELDDLYDEYGIDLEGEETPAKGKKAAKAAKSEKVASGKGKKNAANKDKCEPAVRVPAKTTNLRDEDDFEDFDDYDDEDYDDYDEVDYEEDYGYDNDEPEEMIDDLDELLGKQSQKKRGHMEPDDTFKVDFIDLD